MAATRRGRPSRTSASNDERFRTEFGAALAAQLSASGTNQTTLAELTKVSTSYVNQLVRGSKTASPQWVAVMASTLKLPPEEEEKLHIAAARDAGYKIKPP